MVITEALVSMRSDESGSAHDVYKLVSLLDEADDWGGRLYNVDTTGIRVRSLLFSCANSYSPPVGADERR